MDKLNELETIFKHMKGLAGGVWREGTKGMVLAIDHCLNGNSNYDSSLIRRFYELLHENPEYFPTKAMLGAVRNAAFLITGYSLSIDKESGKVTCKRSAKQWESIEGALSQAGLERLKEKGLIDFKPEQGNGSKGKGGNRNSKVKDKYDIEYEECAKVIKEVASLDPESEVLDWYYSELKDLHNKLAQKLESVKTQLATKTKNSLASKVENTTEAEAA